MMARLGWTENCPHQIGRRTHREASGRRSPHTSTGAGQSLNRHGLSHRFRIAGSGSCETYFSPLNRLRSPTSAVGWRPSVGSASSSANPSDFVTGRLAGAANLASGRFATIGGGLASSWYLSSYYSLGASDSTSKGSLVADAHRLEPRQMPRVGSLRPCATAVSGCRKICSLPQPAAVVRIGLKMVADVRYARLNSSPDRITTM